MASFEEQAQHQAYVEGRLLGLSQLIAVLKEAMEAEESAGSPMLLKSVVLHISNEMDSIISDLKEEHGKSHPAIVSAEKQAASISRAAEKPNATPASMKKHVEAADDLMKNLLALREQEASGGENSEEEQQ